MSSGRLVRIDTRHGTLRARLDEAETDVWNVVTGAGRLCTLRKRRQQVTRGTITRRGSTFRTRTVVRWYVDELPGHGGFSTRKSALEVAGTLLPGRSMSATAWASCGPSNLGAEDAE